MGEEGWEFIRTKCNVGQGDDQGEGEMLVFGVGKAIGVRAQKCQMKSNDWVELVVVGG